MFECIDGMYHVAYHCLVNNTHTYIFTSTHAHRMYVDTELGQVGLSQMSCIQPFYFFFFFFEGVFVCFDLFCVL